MTNRNRMAAALLLAALIAPIPVLAQESDVAGLHAAWRGCLHRSFGLQAVLTSRTLAADTALKACRRSESAYLSALSASPLVDGDDVARVRPALLQRARGWLLTGAAAPRPL